jgi:hypothetical protein
MRLCAKIWWVVALGVSPVVGCNNVYTPPETAPVVLSLSGVESGGSRIPLVGAQVCETGADNCVTANSSGDVTIELPVGLEISYSLQKEGYDSMLIADDIPKSGVKTTWFLNADELQADLYETAMSPYPRRGTGAIFIRVDPQRAGVTFDLIGATGKLYYQEGVAHLGGETTYNVDLTATTSTGRGGFLEVTPGTFEVQFGGNADDCVPTFAGWPGDNENSVEVPVHEDHETIVIVRCAFSP